MKIFISFVAGVWISSVIFGLIIHKQNVKNEDLINAAYFDGFHVGKKL